MDDVRTQLREVISSVLQAEDETSQAVGLTAYSVLYQHGYIDRIVTAVLDQLKVQNLRSRILELETKIRPEMDAEITELKADIEQKALLIDGLVEDKHNLENALTEALAKGKK